MEIPTLEKRPNKLWTPAGLQNLGSLIRQSRNQLKLSQRGVSALIEERTGCYVSDTSLSDIERGNKEPRWNTLVAIAAAEFVQKETGEPYTVEELSAIASESVFFELASSEDLNDSRILIGKKSKPGRKTPIKTMYQFEYSIFIKLKRLMEASRNQLGLSEVQYIRRAESNGITLEEASLFFEDVQDGTYARSHPRARIEAFLPLLFRIKNPRSGFSLDTGRTYAGDLEGLLADLEQLGNGATQQPIHH